MVDELAHECHPLDHLLQIDYILTTAFVVCFDKLQFLPNKIIG